MATHVLTPGVVYRASDDLEARSPGLRALVPVGRALFASIFLVTAPGHFSPELVGYAAANGVPAANVLVPLSGVLSAVGALMVLAGLRARVGAALLALFLLPVTLMMHRFWVIDDPVAAGMQRIQFFKNAALLGGTFLIMHWGAGPLSFDARRRAHTP